MIRVLHSLIDFAKFLHQVYFTDGTTRIPGKGAHGGYFVWMNHTLLGSRIYCLKFANSHFSCPVWASVQQLWDSPEHCRERYTEYNSVDGQWCKPLWQGHQMSNCSNEEAKIQVASNQAKCTCSKPTCLKFGNLSRIKICSKRELHEYATWTLENVCTSIWILPGTQMTLVFVGKGLVFLGWPSEIEVIEAPGMYIVYSHPIVSMFHDFEGFVCVCANAKAKTMPFPVQTL